MSTSSIVPTNPIKKHSSTSYNKSMFDTNNEMIIEKSRSDSVDSTLNDYIKSSSQKPYLNRDDKYYRRTPYNSYRRKDSKSYSCSRSISPSKERLSSESEYNRNNYIKPSDRRRQTSKRLKSKSSLSNNSLDSQLDNTEPEGHPNFKDTNIPNIFNKNNSMSHSRSLSRSVHSNISEYKDTANRGSYMVRRNNYYPSSIIILNSRWL